MNQFDRLLNWIQELSQSLSAFVSHYGIAETIAFEAGLPAIAIGDFFHYCVAKGSKHIRAALVLIDQGFPEDAIVLSRAAYECYVSAAYAKTQGVQAMDDLVYNTVGLNAGTVEYARTKTGGWDYRRLVDKETGTSYHAPPSIERMIRNTGYPADALVHRHYYDEKEKSRIKRELRLTIKQINNVLGKRFKNPADDFVHAVRVRLGKVII